MAIKECTDSRPADVKKSGVHVRLLRKLIPMAELRELRNREQYIKSIPAPLNDSLIPASPAQCSSDAVVETIVRITQASQAVIFSNETSSRSWHAVAESKNSILTLDHPVIHKLLADFSKTIVSPAEPYACIEQIVTDSHPFGILMVPMIVEKRLVGIIALIRDERGTDFTPVDFAACAYAESICSPPLANKVFARELARQKAREEKLLNEICRCQAGERQRIGQELHDGIAQWIVGAAMTIDSCQIRVKSGQLKGLQHDLKSAKETLQTCISELRRAIANLRPILINELGLVGAITQLAQSFNTERLACKVEVKSQLPDFSPAEENTIFWIVQESLNNIHKHADASQARIEFSQYTNSFDISVSDNGKGYDHGNVGESVLLPNKFGLTGMKERANLLGGELMIIGTPGEGTQVILKLTKYAGGPADWRSET